MTFPLLKLITPPSAKNKSVKLPSVPVISPKTVKSALTLSSSEPLVILPYINESEPLDFVLESM